MTTVIRALSSMPSALSFVIIVFVWEAIALGAMALARRWSARHELAAGQPLISAWATVAGALCGLLFAFVIATLWGQDRSIVHNLDSEAIAMRTTQRDIAPSQRLLLEQYATDTISDWSMLCNGGRFVRSNISLDRLLSMAKPRSAALADDFSVQLSTLEKMRDLRQQAARPIIPFEVWTALIVLALAVIAVLAIANPPRLSFHAALTLIIGAEIGTVFWVLTLLELPFCGKTGIGPGEIMRALDIFTG